MQTWRVEAAERLSLDGVVRDLKVRLISGRLNVVGADGLARIEINQVRERPVVVTLTDDGRLRVEHERPLRWPGFLWWLFAQRSRADVSVVVPHDTQVDLTVMQGSVIASSLHSGARVEVTSGKVTLLGLDGDVAARVVSGSIEALSIGGDVALETVSGEIVLADSTAGRVAAHTISGSVTCDLDNPPDNTVVQLDTVSGEIIARVREDSDLQVSLSTASGQVICAFPELLRAGRKTVTGRLGGGAGSGRLVANATSGTISLLRRPVDTEDDDS